MRAISDAVQGQEAPALPDKEAEELHLNAFRTASLRRKLGEGRGWEGALVGLVREILATGETTGLPGWRRYRFQDTSTTFEFDSLAEWITDPNGLGTTPKHLIELLEISPDEEGRKLADRVRQELKLPLGRPAMGTADIIRSTAGEAHATESGTSAAGVRRKIRNWIKANADHPNHALAQQWLAKLEANPRSRLHQQALREIGIGGERKKLLDVTSVSDPLLDRLHAVAKDEGVSVAEVIEDALAVYFRMDDEPREEDGEQPAAQEPAQNGSSSSSEPPAPATANGHHDSTAGIQELPAPGFYSASQLSQQLGRKSHALSSFIAKAPDGGEILQRVLADSPIRVFVRRDRSPLERLEVVAR